MSDEQDLSSLLSTLSSSGLGVFLSKQPPFTWVCHLRSGIVTGVGDADTAYGAVVMALSAYIHNCDTEVTSMLPVKTETKKSQKITLDDL